MTFSFTVPDSTAMGVEDSGASTVAVPDKVDWDMVGSDPSSVTVSSAAGSDVGRCETS